MTESLTALLVRAGALRADPERGSVSVEQVVITVALLAIAVALVAIIARAVASRSGQIQ